MRLLACCSPKNGSSGSTSPSRCCPARASSSASSRKFLFKDETSYRDISVSSDIFMCNQRRFSSWSDRFNFHQEDSHGNPVAVYLQRNGTPQGLL
ncbi:hypothetical protein C8R45DRAFT_1031901, partial [Mycena sanguinolenta]